MATTAFAGETATGADEFAGALSVLTTPGGTAGCGLFDATELAGGATDGGGAAGAGGFSGGATFTDALDVGAGIGGAGAGAFNAIGGADRVLVGGAVGTGFAG